MGVAVLNPQDCLQNPLSSRQSLISPLPRMKNLRNPNPNNATRSQSNRRKHSPKSSSPSRATAASPQTPTKNLVMGQVKILKRGERLFKTMQDKLSQLEEDIDLGSANRLGPDPQAVPTQIGLAESSKANGFYAGSAFITSPPPSSLPLPAFFMKRTKNIDATTDLRRILGLSS